MADYEAVLQLQASLKELMPLLDENLSQGCRARFQGKLHETALDAMQFRIEKTAELMHADPCQDALSPMDIFTAAAYVMVDLETIIESATGFELLQALRQQEKLQQLFVENGLTEQDPFLRFPCPPTDVVFHVYQAGT